MQPCFLNLFEDIRVERSPVLSLSLIYPDTLREPKFTDDEKNFQKNLALEKLHSQKCLKQYFALQPSEEFLLSNK